MSEEVDINGDSGEQPIPLAEISNNNDSEKSHDKRESEKEQHSEKNQSTDWAKWGVFVAIAIGLLTILFVAPGFLCDYFNLLCSPLRECIISVQPLGQSPQDKAPAFVRLNHVIGITSGGGRVPPGMLWIPQNTPIRLVEGPLVAPDEYGQQARTSQRYLVEIDIPASDPLPVMVLSTPRSISGYSDLLRGGDELISIGIDNTDNPVNITESKDIYDAIQNNEDRPLTITVSRDGEFEIVIIPNEVVQDYFSRVEFQNRNSGRKRMYIDISHIDCANS